MFCFFLPEFARYYPLSDSFNPSESLPFHYSLQKRKENLTTSSSSRLPQPKHFRKSCEGFMPIWNPAEIAPSACGDLKLASGTRHYAAAPIFIIYTTTNRALGMTGFVFFSTGRSYYGSCTGNYASHCVPWITFLLKSPAQELSSLSSSLLKLSDLKALTSTAANFIQYALSTVGASYFECKKKNRLCSSEVLLLNQNLIIQQSIKTASTFPFFLPMNRVELVKCSWSYLW